MSYINNNYFKSGSWNAVCDLCSGKFKADDLKKRWDGLIVCAKDWESDHPQKYIRVRSDPKPVPFIRTDPEEIFIHVCTPTTSSGMADYATADCARADVLVSNDLIISIGDQTSAISGIAITGLAISGVS